MPLISSFPSPCQDSRGSLRAEAGFDEAFVDKHILRLIKGWVKAPIVVERADGKRVIEGGKRSTRGTPQGGVLSPLLANIHLHEWDRHWRDQQLERRLNARLVRVADDVVVLWRGRAEAARREVRAVLCRLGLTLNDAKTRRVDLWDKSLTFLGFELAMRQSPRTGRGFPLVRPSRKALARVRHTIHAQTTRGQFHGPPAEVMAELNQQVRGRVQYFYYGHCTQEFRTLRRYLADRVRNYLLRRRRRRAWVYSVYPDPVLHGRYGLYAIPLTAPWRAPPAHARR